jgi:hypothetical protein
VPFFTTKDDWVFPETRGEKSLNFPCEIPRGALDVYGDEPLVWSKKFKVQSSRFKVRGMPYGWAEGPWGPAMKSFL